MQDDFHQLLKQYPTIAAKNPQLNLLNEDEQVQLQIYQSELYRSVWSKQKKIFAKFSADTPIRKYVEPADRFRDITRTKPIDADTCVEWPDFDPPRGSNGSDRQGAGPVFVDAMQTPEQGKALEVFFDKICQRLSVALSHPGPVFEDRYAVRVEFLDCIAWVALKVEKVIKMEVKDSAGDWQLSTLRFDLLKPMQTASWIDQVLLAWVEDLARTFQQDAPLAFRFLHKELGKRFHNKFALQGVRQQVTRHMVIDPLVISAFRHIKHQSGAQQTLMNTEMADIWPKANFWGELFEKYPDLLLLCHIADKGKSSGTMRDVSEVRSTCLQHGLSPSGWRYLLKQGEASYIPVIHSGISISRAFPMAIGLVQWQNQSGLKGTLPKEMALAYVNFAAMTLPEAFRIADFVDPRIARIATAHYITLEQEEARTQFAEKDWLDVLIWLRNTQPDIDKNQWRAGWSCIWNKYQEWLGEQDTTSEWESRIGDLSLFGMKVRALMSSVELCLEGMRMNHCISSYATRCRNGTYRVFSIRCGTSEKRMATVGLKFEDNCWQFDEANGKNNQQVSAEVETLCQSLAQFYQQSHTQYETGTRVAADVPRQETPVRTARSFHLKVSNSNHLMVLNDEGSWESAQTEHYPISPELKSKFGAGRIQPAEQGSNMASAELTIRLRLELPSEYTLYIWDQAEYRDRPLRIGL